jgi:serine/threonine protein kinase
VPGLGRRIALDVARGLHFLHTNRIVHMVSSIACWARFTRHISALHGHCSSWSKWIWHLLQDVKTANVLLGRNYVTKISDVSASWQLLCIVWPVL